MAGRKKRGKWGGRRFGLLPKGPAPKVLVTMTPDDLDALDALAALWELTRAQAIQRLIRDEAARKP